MITRTMSGPNARDRLAALTRAVAAAVVLAILLVGVPMALSRAVGWPLPTSLPTIDDARIAVRDGLADTFWLKAFALVAWLAWLQVAWAVVAEIVALARGRAPRARLGCGWAQELAARLVGAVVMVTSLAGPAPHVGAADWPVAVQAARMSSAPSLPMDGAVAAGSWADLGWPAQLVGEVDVAGPGAPMAVEGPPVPAATSHLVVRGESLSSIAEDELGTQAAWPTIWEANRGRPFGSRVFDDPNLILPGWDLLVPGTGLVAAPQATSESQVEPVLIPPIVIRAGDEPPTSPEAPAAELPRTPAIVTSASADLLPAAATPVDQELPAESEPAVAEDAAPSSVDTAPASAGADRQQVAGADLVTSEVAQDDDAPAWARLAAFLGATLLATGAAGMVVSSRRRALRAGHPGSAVVAPDPQVGDTLIALTAGSDALATARLELALRALAGRLGRSGSEARPVAIRRRADALEVVLDRAADVGGPWTIGPDGSHWELPATIALEELIDDARAVAPPCPALVGIGRDQDGAECYVDLEAMGTFSIASGPSGSAALRMLMATLAVTPLADGLRLVMVGPAGLELRGRHEVRTVADVAAAISEVEALTASIASVTAGAPSTFRLRTVAGHESWEPVVVVLTEPAPAEADLARLQEMARSHRGVAVVGIDLGDDGARLVVEADGLARVGPAGWPVRPHGLSEDDLSALAVTLDAADHLLVESGTVDPSGGNERPAGADPEAVGALARPWSLMVRVLGPVDVVDRSGQPASFERAKAMELVVWLAQHAASGTRAGARAALWEVDVSNASFSNVVSEARRALARLAAPPDGEEWVARTYVERLPLHPLVVLDADIVEEHLARARALPDDEAIVELRAALALVRGAPYADRSYLWPDAEALPSTLTLLVTTVAAELAQRLLAAGDTEGVFGATAVGLDVLPGHEELIALRLRTHALKGDRSALRREYASYEQAVLADPWDGEPAPTLVALRRELLDHDVRVPVAGD